MFLMISSLGTTLESPPNPRFGRSEFYIKYNLEDDEWEAINNPAALETGGAGVAAAQFLSNQSVSVAISGRFGPNAYRALKAADIQMLTFNQLFHTVQEVIEAYRDNRLDEV